MRLAPEHTPQLEYVTYYKKIKSKKTYSNSKYLKKKSYSMF